MKAVYRRPGQVLFTNALACMNDNDQRQVYTTQCAPPEEILGKCLVLSLCLYKWPFLSLFFSIYLAHKTFSHAKMGVITTPGAGTGNCLV